ncbi:MAG: hypothetical protein EBX50_14860 [Chitinophagia bacterium]|nr:hypothetical protein [Chitinophagia bacterium]
MSEEDSIITESNEYSGNSFFELEDNRSIERTWIEHNCIDKNNYLTSEDYTDSDYSDMYVIKLLNSKNKFNLGTCSTKEELITSLKTDLNFDYAPSNIMCIYTSPIDGNPVGYGSKPTIKIIIKITVGNYFVTLGSVYRILTEPNKIWYALPMFGGKKRRIGNLAGIIGSNMNHGQIPGFIIYKLYTKEEIINRIRVVEDIHIDYPLDDSINNSIDNPIDNSITNNTLLPELLNNKNINLKTFIKKIIKKCQYLYNPKYDSDLEKEETIPESIQRQNLRTFIDFNRLGIRPSPSSLSPSAPITRLPPPTQSPNIDFTTVGYSSAFNFRHAN